MKALIVYIKDLKSSKKGQGTVEYGLVLFMVALAVTLALRALGQKVADLLNSVSF